MHSRQTDGGGLASSPVYCGSPVHLPNQGLSREGRTVPDIGPDSSAFDFDSSRSYFAAFRIAELRRPAPFEQSSFGISGLGWFGELLPGIKSLALEPIVLRPMSEWISSGSQLVLASAPEGFRELARRMALAAQRGWADR